jgi:hypothetical protein
VKEATLISEPKLFGPGLKQHRLFILRREFFLTLEITPGFILQDMVGVVHIGKAAKLAGVSVAQFASIKDSDSSRLRVAARADIACSTASRFVTSHLCDMPKNWGSL